MEKALILAAIIGPFYLVFGLSILMYVKQWKKIYTEFQKNHFIMMGNMILSLVAGLIIINMHNVWEWNLFVVITVTGWAALLKAVFYFLAPSDWIKQTLKSKIIRKDSFLYFWGAVMTVLGLLLTYNGYWL